ncbi:zinc-dependent metalloprotease [Chitinophaga pinensis]|uniref:Zinc-dependent metalloprotease n=1 Tax=Chitinophaga pinensis TaxID=79329 RepID=A0A5C6LPR2_9BACT|nr:zinc-dependent metalloprotease [Chitinophaga pinensis]TWV97428.1 zinc-dependent metalloprotease [Chitinophaga pinensis]
MKSATTHVLLGALCALTAAVPASAQKHQKGKDTATPNKDSVAAALAKVAFPAKQEALKPYREVIPANAITSNGLFKVHKSADKYYFEIPDSLLGRDLLVVSRISKGSSDYRPMILPTYAGDQIGEKVIRFEKSTGNKIFLQTISYRERAADSSSNGLYRSLMNNNLQPIQAAFAVKAVNDSSKSSVIEMTDYLNNDNSVFFFDAGAKALGGLNMMAADRSYIGDVHAYPMNIEIKSVRTYTGRPMPVTNEVKTYSFELNSSIVLLPSIPMQSRFFDPRVGFFADEYIDFDANPQGIKTESLIWKWRLEPRREDIEKYKRGELVTPEKPIIIYIDPLTPKKWVPYLIAGVNDWQAAFEAAGFKDAIIAKEAPADDSTWSIEDARHSVLVYKPSSMANAMGPSIKDPRTGEILETHINWYHNVMDMLYKWYFIQAGAIDKRAQAPQLPDDLMGELIRFVSSHEVGHTLGLRHNWGASSTVPVDSLRSKRWVEENGHTPSIMDYARFNYVAQPEDNIGPKGIFPRIGAYDKWAIEWAYRVLPDTKSPVEETPSLNKMVMAKLASGKQYFFGIERVPWEAATHYDPRNQREDLGDDAMKAGAYGIANLKRIEKHLMDWTRQPNEDYSKAGEMYNELVKQFDLYMGHAAANIGGILTTPKTVEQAGPVYEFPAKSKQQRAMAFLQEQLFTTPMWLNDTQLAGLTKTSFAVVTNVQKKVLFQLLSPDVLDRLSLQENVEGANAYTTAQFLRELKQGIFSELAAHKTIDTYRRGLQRVYVERLLMMITPGPQNPLMPSTALSKDGDALPQIKAHAKALADSIRAAVPQTSDEMTRSHLQDLYDRLDNGLHPRK